jgi:hypothetical protein
MRRAWIALLVSTCSLGGTALAQGISPYLNFETPPHKPIAVVKVGTADFVLVCNIPDNSIEVYSSANDVYTVLSRLPVGLEPITVVVKPTALASGARRCYTANWLGDSITAFDVDSNGVATLVRTQRVGDEPTGLAFRPVTEDLLVTFSAPGNWSILDATTLAPLSTASQNLELIAQSGTEAVKEARALAFSPATSTFTAPNRLCVLNFRGGNTPNGPSGYDFDVWSLDNARIDDLVAGTINTSDLTSVSGTGTTNFNMDFAPNGDLYIAAQNARNRSLTFGTGTPEDAFVLAPDGEAQMRALVTGDTGFVRSQLVRVRGVGNATPVVDVLDLNLTTLPTAISQPTDVLVYGSGADDQTRIFVCGFGSDSLGMIRPLTGQPWDVTRIRTSTLNGFSPVNLTGTVRGPRAMALKVSGIPNDPNDRLYVYNHLEHSFTVVKPAFDVANLPSAIIKFVTIAKDPTPAYIKDARKFLYSTKLSGGKTVSCASCHIDGHTDFLAWNLSDDTTSFPAQATPPSGEPPAALGPNFGQKGPMQTQSLRGLVNFEVAQDAIQDKYFSNKPYHWRGDRATFNDFNGAFDKLMGLSTPPLSDSPTNPNDPIDELRRLVNSIHYPPNPLQQTTRMYSGSLGNPQDLTNLPGQPVASGALMGLKQFHIGPFDAGLSCVHCHSLPDGSNSRLTETFSYIGYDPALPDQSIETAQLRSIVQKDRLVIRVPPSGPAAEFQVGSGPISTGEFGLFHTGKTTGNPIVGSQSTDGFINIFDVSNPGLFDRPAMNQFLRELDVGVAPMIGNVRTIDATSLAADPSGTNTQIAALERQVFQANAGLVVQARINSQTHAFWYQLNPGAQTYVEEPQAGVPPLPGTFNRAQLLALLGAPALGNVLVFISTPLGSARRIAHLDNTPVAPLTIFPPGTTTLLGCRPASHNTEIASLTGNWYAAALAGSPPVSLYTRNRGNAISILLFQASLKNFAYDANVVGFDANLHDFRHEPPRRFCIQGEDISDGAWLRITVPNADDWSTVTVTVNGTPPSTTTVVTAPTTGPTSPGWSTREKIELPLFASAATAQSSLVWQTAAEMDALQLLALMNGGRGSTAVETAMTNPDSLRDESDGILSHAPTAAFVNYFDPARHNWFYVQVINDPNNPTTTTNAGSWQRLFMQ